MSVHGYFTTHLKSLIESRADKQVFAKLFTVYRPWIETIAY